MLLARGEYQAALTELMVTFLLDMEAYKRTVRFPCAYICLCESIHVCVCIFKSHIHTPQHTNKKTHLFLSPTHTHSYTPQLLLNPSAAAEQQLLPPSNLDEVAKSAARMMVEELEVCVCICVGMYVCR